MSYMPSALHRTVFSWCTGQHLFSFLVVPALFDRASVFSLKFKFNLTWDVHASHIIH